MPDPMVSDVGTVQGIDGNAVTFGVDYDTVTIRAPGGVVRLDWLQATPVVTLMIDAARLAVRQRAHMDEADRV
jgi:hypothetical protein